MEVLQKPPHYWFDTLFSKFETKEMRILLNKRSSTKAERIFSEILKKNHIPFKYSIIIEGKEIDFLIGKLAIEIDGHDQDDRRNGWLIGLGLTPVHYSNHLLLNHRSDVEEDIKSKYKYGFFS